MKNTSSSRMLRPVFFILLACVAVAAAATTQPDQYAASWLFMAAFIPLAIVQSPNRFFLRVLLFFLGAFITFRYLMFRTFYTLHFDETLHLTLAVLLFLAECYAIAVHFFGLFVSLNPKQRPVPPLPDKLPTIDVFIPTYDEDPSVAIATAMACKNFDYPERLVTVYILDDGCRLPRLNTQTLRDSLLSRHERLRQAARDIGAVYLTRESGTQAKAGMINAAFRGEAFAAPVPGEDGFYAAGERVRTTGDLILILDCDHIPTRDMPAKVVGHFADPKLFLAQTPHFMLNADPVRKNLGDEVHLPGEGWLFYRNVLRGLDRWNAAFFCGSAAFLRRSILEETGGLCGDTITEDCETSLALHAKGYSSVYIDTPLVAGLEPESFSDMIKQRRRWCQGMLQILLLKRPFLHRGLTLAQRFSYMNNCLFWLFPLARVVFLLAPLMFPLFNINIYNASVEQVVMFAGPHIISSMLLAVIIHGKLRPLLYSEILESLQTVFLLPSIASVLIAPKKPVFLTTRKGVTLEKDSLSPLAWPFFIFFLLFLAGFALGLRIWLINPLLRDTVYITVFWNTYNFIIILCCLGAVWERRQRRGAHRARLAEPVTLDGTPAILNDLSLTGIGLTLSGGAFAPDQEYVFSAPELTARVRLVRVDGDRAAGVFTGDAGQRALIGYVYGDSRRWRQMMDDVPLRHGGYIRQSLHLLAAGARSGLLAMGGAVRKLFIWTLLPFMSAVLLPSDAAADTFSRSVSSLVRGDRFLVQSAEGELHIPFYLSGRSRFESVTLNVAYSRSPRFPQGQPPMYVVIDGERVDGTIVASGDGSLTAAFVLPKSKLVPGERVVILRVAQTLPATGGEPEEVLQRLADGGELWTSFDLRRSFLVIDYTPRSLTKEEKDDFHFIFDERVIAPKSVHVVLPEITEATVARAFEAVQRIALAMGERPLLISVSGTVDESKDCVIVGDDSAALRDAAPDDPRHIILTEADIPPVGEDKRYVLGMNTTRTFKSLGLDSMTLTPASSPRVGKFLVPTPTYLTPNRSLLVSLNLAYSDGLHSDSRLEIGVNDEVLTWVHLPDTGGGSNQQYGVRVPTSLLAKGFNLLQVKPVIRPASGGQWANNVSGLAVTVFSSSALTLPDTGTYVRMPELATIFTDGYPFSGDGLFCLETPTPDVVAASLNLGAFIVQHRGTESRGEAINFGPWSPSAKNGVDFSLDPELPERSLLLRASLVPDSENKVRLTLRARSAKELLQGIQALWQDNVHEKISGTEALLYYETGRIESRGGETRIISDIGPLDQLAYYANNYPLPAWGGLAALLLLLVLTGYILAKNVNT